MKRHKSRDPRYKTATWNRNQKLQAVTTYLALGNMAQTAIATGIPLQTLKSWKTTEWFKEYCLKVQAEDVQQMDSNLKKIVEKSLRAIEDRLDNGDAIFDFKTGEIIRVPVKAQVATKIASELMNQKRKNQEIEQKQELRETVNDRLLKLSEEFSRFAKTGKLSVAEPELLEPIVDVVAKEVSDGFDQA